LPAVADLATSRVRTACREHIDCSPAGKRQIGPIDLEAQILLLREATRLVRKRTESCDVRDARGLEVSVGPGTLIVNGGGLCGRHVRQQTQDKHTGEVAYPYARTHSNFLPHQMSSGDRPRRAAVFGLPASIVATLLVTSMARTAQAQDIGQYINSDVPGFGTQPGVTVPSRLRPEYDYLGTRAGDFIILPQLDESIGYDSNVTGTKPSRGSGFLETQGSLNINSQWAKDSLGAAITMDNNDYFSQQNQSYTNWTASLGGTHVFGQDTLYAGFTHLNINQTSLDLGVPQLDKPIAYRVDDAHVNYKMVFSQFALQPGIEVANYNYDNGTVAGAPYLQSYRNRVVVTPSMQMSYEFAPLQSLLLVVKDADAHHTTQLFDTPTLDYNDFSVLGGVSYSTGGPMRYLLLAGYETRNFHSRQFATISAPVVEAKAIWTPTGLTTVTATAARYIEDSSSDNTVGYTETALKLAVDHEYSRNILLNAHATFYHDSYAQSDANQSYFAAGFGATWLINHHMRLAASYQYSNRQSNNAAETTSLFAGEMLGGSYSDNRFLLQLRIGL
jgi:hypothetical protein